MLLNFDLFLQPALPNTARCAICREGEFDESDPSTYSLMECSVCSQIAHRQCIKVTPPLRDVTSFFNCQLCNRCSGQTGPGLWCLCVMSRIQQSNKISSQCDSKDYYSVVSRICYLQIYLFIVRYFSSCLKLECFCFRNPVKGRSIKIYPAAGNVPNAIKARTRDQRYQTHTSTFFCLEIPTIMFTSGCLSLSITTANVYVTNTTWSLL